MKKVVCLLSLLLIMFTVTGCGKSNKVDFELVSGSMVSKENMTDEEQMLHDAKVIQYGLYKAQQIVSKGYSLEGSLQLADIAAEVNANRFYNKEPRSWLYNYYHFFGDYDKYCKGLKIDSEISNFKKISLQSHWRALSSEIGDIIAATDKFVGASFAERANLDENLKNNLLPILNEINSETCKTIYRNADASHEYMFGTQPEPTEEAMNFAIEKLQEMLKVAPIGEMSTVTLANIYVNNMIERLENMKEDYAATRKDPTYKTMHVWGQTHARLGANWTNFLSLVNSTKALFSEESPSTLLTTKKEVIVGIDLTLPDSSDDINIKVYVDGELQKNMTTTISGGITNKQFDFTGLDDEKIIVKFKVNDENYKMYEIDFSTKEVTEL